MPSQHKPHEPDPKEKEREAAKNAAKTIEEHSHEAEQEEETAAVELAIEDLRERDLENLKKALEEEKKKADQYLTSLKYLRAEFENYQKRIAKEMEELTRRGSERLARKLLTVIDDLERTISASKAVGETSKLLDGLEMILKELHKALKSEGITRIESVGKKFDPSLHEAVMVTQTDKYPANTVVEELRPGYMSEDGIIRPSMVAVSNMPEKRGEPVEENKSAVGESQEVKNKRKSAPN